jgi:hypothetical protein
MPFFAPIYLRLDKTADFARPDLLASPAVASPVLLTGRLPTEPRHSTFLPLPALL